MEDNFFDDLDDSESYHNNSNEYNIGNFNVNLGKIMKVKNTISSTLKLIALFLIVLGFIVGLILGTTEENIKFSSILTIWLIYGVVSLGIFALAEIIQILHDIRYKVWSEKN